MIPVLEALEALLISEMAIADAVRISGENYHIYGPKRVMPTFKNPLPHAIVLQRVGGQQARPRTYVRCYANDPAEAEALYRLLFPLFYNDQDMPRGQRKVAGKWLLYWGTLTEPFTTIEPQGWPVSSGTLETKWHPRELAA